MNGSARVFNPAAHHAPPTRSFNGYRQQNNVPSSVSNRPPSSPYIEARLSNLEEQHGSLRSDVDKLAEMCHSLHNSVDKVKQGSWPVHIGPFQEHDPAQSRQSALRFREEFDQITSEVHGSMNGGPDKTKTNGIVAPKDNSSVPPHLRAKSTSSNRVSAKSVPPHLQGIKNKEEEENNTVNGASDPFADKTKDKYESLITDGPIDTSVVVRPAQALSPLSSTPTAVQGDVSIGNIQHLALDRGWQPHYLTTLEPLPLDVVSKIPSKDMVTFHPEFIKNHLAGVLWSPGLRFINTAGPGILRNRTYYELDSKIDPYIPRVPGTHGAKLTAFFNKSPEETHGDLFAEDVNTYENVPMLVEQKNAKGQIRYVYFGNYSQTRWSDKLDYDTMKTKVPQHVKEYWATELADTALREAWITEALKNHFFPKPEYEGYIFAGSTDDTTADTEEETKREQAMCRNVKRYVASLRNWEREANMKTAHIKKQAILNAFDAADADDPPALRLWWEYLECVDWNKDFYNLLVTLQSRDKERYLA